MSAPSSHGSLTKIGSFLLAGAVLSYALVVSGPALAQADTPPSADDDWSEDYDYEYSGYEGWGVTEDGVGLPSDADVRRVFENPDYDFCNDPDYVLAYDERPLCVFAESAKTRCPELSTACARPEAEDRWPQGWQLGSSSDNDGKGRHARSRTHGKSRPPPPDWSFELPPFLSEVFRVLFWVLAIGGVIGVIAYLASNWIRGWLPKRKTSESPELPATDDSPATRQPDIVERDVQRLLARAREQAQRGEFDEAIASTHAAMLRFLDGRSLVNLRHSRTNGDHIASLSAHPELQQVLRQVTGQVERSQFGHHPPSADTFRELLSRVQGVITTTATMLCLVLASPILGGCGSDDGDERTTPTRWGVLADTSVVGFGGLGELLNERGITTTVHVGGIDQLSEEATTLVVYDPTTLQEQDWIRLEEWVQEGHRLVIAGEPTGAAHFGVSFDVKCEDQPTTTPAAASLNDYRNATTGALGVGLVAPIRTLTVDEPHTTWVSCGENPLVVRRDLGIGDVIVFSDADLLSNASLAAGDNAALALSLFAAQSHVAFAGEMVGVGANSPYEALTGAKLGPLLLQALIVLLMFYWARGVLFGPPRTQTSVARHDFVDHIRALGQLYRRRKAKSHALATYSAWALERLFERVRPGTRMSVFELAEAVSQRTGKDQRRVLQTLVEASTAKNRPANAPPEPQDLETLKDLESLVIKTGGAK